MAPRKRAKTDGPEPVAPPTIECIGSHNCGNKSWTSDRLKQGIRNVRTVATHAQPYKLSATRAEITGAAALIANDLSRVPAPTGSHADGLFEAEPKSVLYSGTSFYCFSDEDPLGPEMYTATIEFNEPVILKSVTVSGLNLCLTTATLSVAPNHFRHAAAVCEKTADRSHAVFKAAGLGNPQPPIQLVTLEPVGFVGQRFTFCERLRVSTNTPDHGFHMLAAYRSGVMLEYERYTPSVGGAGLPSLCADLGTLVDNEELCDVTFVCAGGGEVRAVRALLAARCTYFRTLLFGALRESRLERVNVECSAPALRFVVCYLHTGGTAMSHTEPPEVLIDAHKLADVYLLPPLKAYCLHALDAALTAENCQQALLIAHGRGLPEAKTVCLRYVVDNYEETFEAMDELIGANEPALLKEVFAVTKVHLMEGETVQLGDHQNQDHF